MDAKQIVKQAQEVIAASELKDSLLPLWNLIEWQVHAESTEQAASTVQSLTGAELCRRGGAVIHLYPSLRNAVQVLREFGTFVHIRSGERGAALWKSKLDIPTKEQIETAKNKLECPEVRQKCRSYADVLKDYPDKGHSVDRLVFINISNALLANNIAYRDSVGVDIMTWGPTTEYCQLRKYHCLVPLVSAYAPAVIYEQFGVALNALLSDNLARVRDSSVADALRRILRRIVRVANPE